MKLNIDGHEFEISSSGQTLTVEDRSLDVTVEGEIFGATVTVGNKRFKIHMVEKGEDTFIINVDGKLHNVHVAGALRASSRGRPERPKGQPNIAEGRVLAIMPGRVVSIRVREGDHVEEGDILLVLEAMKMENEIRSPAAGKVTSIPVTAGVSVAAGDVLVIIE